MFYIHMQYIVCTRKCCALIRISVDLCPLFPAGQGRKISYSKEKDQAIADHVKELLGKGERVSVQYLCSHAKCIIQEDNPHFIASTGWAQRFLLRHGIDLGNQRSKRDAANKSESGQSPSDSRGRPLSYSSETDKAIAEYVRSRQAEGQVVGNSELRKYAKERVLKENPNFTGSASWAQNFLLRHKLSLHSLPDAKETPVSPPLALSSITAALSSESPLGPAAEITPTSVSPVLADPTVSVSDTSVGVGADYTPDSSSDDPMKTALAILTGDNIDTAILNPAQAAALQSTLSELTSDTVTLVDLLNSAQQIQEHTGGEGAVALITQGLDSPAGNTLYLGLPGTSEAFNVGLTGAAATQVNPNTQTPTNASLLRIAALRSEFEPLQAASRPLSYTKETDQALANWVQEQQAAGKKVTFASLRAYAKKLVSSENPNFNASVGWVTPFLLRHNLDLSVNKKKKQPRKTSTPRKVEPSESSSEDMGEKLLESVETVPLPLQHPGAQVVGETGGTPVLIVDMNDTHSTPTATEPSLEGAPCVNMEVSQLGNLQEAPIPQGNLVPSHQNVPRPMDTSILGAVEHTVPKFLSPMRKVKGQRVRHTLSEKLEVVKLMREHNMAAHYVCRMLGIANSTLAGWIKLVQQKGPELETLSTNKKRANVSGQGRPLSYSKEKDEAIARWVRSQQELGVQVTPSDLAKYATSVIGEENSNFTASTGWQQKFLVRHNLQLTPKAGEKTPLVEDQQNIPAPVQTEEVVTHSLSSSLLEKPYSDEIDQQLVQWVRENVADNGSLSVQMLCRKAEELVVDHNPMFVATLGWAFKFLHRHNLMLDPKPTMSVIDGAPPTPSRKRGPDSTDQNYLSTPKKLCPAHIEGQDISVSPSTGNLCEALLALSNQAQEGMENSPTVQAAVQAFQSAVAALQQQQSSSQDGQSQEQSTQTPSTTYFGKPAREFTSEEKEEVVRYANATTLQKAALKYGVAAPTVWRWRVELKLHQPKYTNMQKKYIIKFAEANSLKEASQRYGITSKTIQNWRRALQAEGELPAGPLLEDLSGYSSTPQDLQGDIVEPPGDEGAASEVVTYDTQNFQFIVDGGEVSDTSGNKEQGGGSSGVRADPVPLEVTNEVDIENVGMEYDVVSSEGHAAKPRCTPQEKAQILQYALEHSVKEASQKFGIPPGTLYYWRKSMSGSQTGERNSSQVISSVSSTSAIPLSTTAVETASPETVMNVQYAGIAGEGNVIQALNPAATPGTEVLQPEQFITSTGISTESTQALSQALANINPEVLQNLNLPADINLLQAVSSLLSNMDSEGDASRKRKTSTSRRHDSSSGGISSPTEVLVTPFQPPVGTEPAETSDQMESVPQVASTEEVLMSENSEITVSTSEDTPEPPTAISTTSAPQEQISGLEIEAPQEHPTVGEDIEVKTSSSQLLNSIPESETVPEVADISQTVELSDSREPPTSVGGAPEENTPEKPANAA